MTPFKSGAQPDAVPRVRDSSPAHAVEGDQASPSSNNGRRGTKFPDEHPLRQFLLVAKAQSTEVPPDMLGRSAAHGAFYWESGARRSARTS
jgi:hypothetical protein